MSDEHRRGADLIAAERQRQVEQEGWTADHDARYADDDLAFAAICYALPPYERSERRWRWLWPWRAEDFKATPDDRVRELVKAGALIAAEIDHRLAAGTRRRP